MKWEEKFLKKQHFDFKVGDEVKISVKVKEGEKKRIQVFEGIVISRRGSGLNETFKVRKISFGIGIERTFPLHSHAVSDIKVKKRGLTRRAKLYYLRDKVGKGIKIKAEEMMTAPLSTETEKLVETPAGESAEKTPIANETK
ncbi:MAG: 50S ribosomal protein L19 [Candidatus Firestonebacteria bacterium]